VNLPIITLVAIMGMGVCMWVLSDVWRLLVLEILYRLHFAHKKIIVEHIVAAHLRVVCGYSAQDCYIEDLSETVIEVIAPFID
jgi:hypothetical protein